MTARPGLLVRLADLGYRRRGRTVLAWVVALAAVLALSTAYAGTFTADYSARGSDSEVARILLTERFPAVSGQTIDVVVRARGTRQSWPWTLPGATCRPLSWRLALIVEAAAAGPPRAGEPQER